MEIISKKRVMNREQYCKIVMKKGKDYDERD